MKTIDILLIVVAIALLVASYYVYRSGNAELGAIVSFGACLCGAAFGARWGGRQYKKNQENK
ncbi:MAG: hypothetical protein IKH88_00920 [Prevotella sp.]|nr:hypothetical protein [Prevotella sp.]